MESGDRVLLERSLFAPRHGQVGRMSVNELRQQKYSFVIMAALTSRAAIRGGLPAETAFSLSDLYCQRADVLTDAPPIQNLTFTMLMDFCGKVREIRRRPRTSAVIEKCLDYISVHLHEPIGLEQLSRHCGLCGRSLSLRFKAELGMGVPEYIHREKLREAEYLLRHTEYSPAASHGVFALGDHVVSQLPLAELFHADLQKVQGHDAAAVPRRAEMIVKSKRPAPPARRPLPKN